MDAAAEIGRNPVSKHQFSLSSMETSKLTRDGTGEYVSRDLIIRRERTWTEREILILPVQLTTSRIHNLAICDDHAYISIK